MRTQSYGGKWDMSLKDMVEAFGKQEEDLEAHKKLHQKHHHEEQNALPPPTTTTLQEQTTPA
jgi:hypothetical protein